MLRLSRKTVLAIEAVLDVAYFGRAGPIQAKEITARQGVPQRYLEQVMQQLVHEGVLKGVRGPRGGYVLARERRRLTVGDIVRAVAVLETSDEEEALSKSDLGVKVVAPLWRDAEAALLAELDTLTIEALCARATHAGVPRVSDEDGDFAI